MVKGLNFLPALILCGRGHVWAGSVSLSHGSASAIAGRIGGDRVGWHTDPSHRIERGINKKPSGRPVFVSLYHSGTTKVPIGCNGKSFLFTKWQVGIKHLDGNLTPKSQRLVLAKHCFAPIGDYPPLCNEDCPGLLTGGGS